MSENPNETKLVNFAMANSIRRKIINFLADGYRSTGEIGEIVDKATLGFHLNILKDAGLIELEEETVKLSEYGTNFLKGKKEKNAEEITDFSQAKPIEIARVKQVLPCIADSSKLRVSANMTPPLGGVLKLLEPLFPRSNYSDRKDSLIIQKGEIITTIYGSGKVSIRMVENEYEAKEELERLKSIINEAIAKGEAPAPREKVKVDLMIPIGLALIEKGMSVGAVLGLVIGGAGASIPELALLSAIFKKKLLAAFVVTIFSIAVVASYLANLMVF